jgi:hypothetical protein
MVSSKDEILIELWNSAFLDEIIWKITSGHYLKEDLKAELFSILTEMNEKKLKKAHKEKWIVYLCINILKKQYHSSSSPFHKKWRGNENECELIDGLNAAGDEGVFDNEFAPILQKVMWIVDNKLDLVDRELFKIYYKFDKYDKHFGEMRDINCKKSVSSLRKIQKKLEIVSVEGKPITISKDMINMSLKRSIMIIRTNIKKMGFDDDVFN